MTEQDYQTRIAELESENTILRAGKISITQIGVHIPRDGLGNPLNAKAVDIYALTSDLQAACAVPPPQDEDKTYTDIAGIFCAKHKAYIEAARAAKNELKRAKAQRSNT